MTVHPTVPEILGDRDGSRDPWLEWTCEQGGLVWVVCVCIYSSYVCDQFLNECNSCLWLITLMIKGTSCFNTDTMCHVSVYSFILSDKHNTLRMSFCVALKEQ